MRLLEEARKVATETWLEGTPISQLLKRPGFGTKDLPRHVASIVPFCLWELVENDFKYEGYAAQQSEQNRQIQQRQYQIIPDGLDYSRIPGLRLETRQKLGVLRPTSLGQAARISGITPADIAIISIWLVKNKLQDSTAAMAKLPTAIEA
jgi:tRNA uridine 5-carboxymethylaminomethyl modification enzyme